MAIEKSFLVGLWLWCSVVLCKGYAIYSLEELCGAGTLPISLAPNGTNSGVILKATSHTSFRYAMTCLVIFTVPEGYGIVTSIRQIALRVNTPDTTCVDYVKILYDPSEEATALCSKDLDFDEATSYATPPKKNTLLIEYHTDQSDVDNKTLTGYAGFEFTVTAFRSDSVTIPPEEKSEYFSCDNGRLIWSGLQCDGRNNCGDMSDESVTGASGCEGQGSNWYVYMFGVLLAVVFVCLITIAAFAKKKRNRRFRQMRRRTRSTAPIVDVLQTRR